MILKVTQGHRNCRYSIGYDFQLVVYSYNDSILYHFPRNISVYAVRRLPVTLRSTSFSTRVEIKSYVRFPIHV